MSAPSRCDECKGKGHHINERKRVLFYPGGPTQIPPQYYVACRKCKGYGWLQDKKVSGRPL